MRPDEGGCADLRRSLTARTKLVRSPTYAPARTPRPRAGGHGAHECARGVSVAIGAAGTLSQKAHRRARGYRVRLRRPAPARPPGPYREATADPAAAGTARRAGHAPRTLAGTASSAPDGRASAAVATASHRRTTGSGHPCRRTRRAPARCPSVPRRRGPGCRDVKSRHSPGDRTTRPPLPLDATASPEFPGIRGECERDSRGPWKRGRRQDSAIGALSYDTYARAAAPASRRGDTPRGPACTRA